MSASHLSMILGGQRKATADVCIDIARALGESPIDALRAAHKIVSDPDDVTDPLLKRYWELGQQLPRDKLETVLEMIRALV